MNPKTDKLLQQAGKYIALGKLTLALEQYLKLQGAEPEDTTIVNTIGDLYVRLEDRENALLWYQKLAEAFEYRELYSNAMATYRKILKLSPKNQDAMRLLAQLYERQGQTQNAKTQYQMLAKLKMSLNDHSEAISLLKKVCALDASCGQSQKVLAQSLEAGGNTKEAIERYLQSAATYAKQDDRSAALEVVDNVFRLRPTDKETVRSFFVLLQGIGLNQRATQYLSDVSLDQDPEFKLMLCEMFLAEGNLEAARKLVQKSVRQCPALYKPAIRILEGSIRNGDVNASIEMVEELFEMSMSQRDESTMKVLLDSLLELDENNSRLLKTLIAVLIRMNGQDQLEGYLKRLALVQLRAGERAEARESLNRLAVYSSSDFYLDLLRMMDDAGFEQPPVAMKKTMQKVIEALEAGKLQKEQAGGAAPVALGVSELDLGMGLAFEEEFAFAQESV